MTNTEAGGSSADHIHVAAGTGILARRDTALLFMPDVGAGCDELLATFTTSEPGAVVEAVTDAATTAGFELDPFVLVTWADEVHIVVLGAIEVHTDHASLPMLSGAGSGSWVERRLRLGPEPATIRAGAAASSSTDLQLGRVASSGFSARFSTGTTRPRQPSTAPPSTSSPTSTSPTSTSPTSTSPPPAVRARAGDTTGPIATDRLAALRAAMRSPVDDDASTGSRTTPLPVDDEVTLAPEVLPPPEVTPASQTPTPEVTTAPRDPRAAESGAGDDDQAPFVAARRCGRGHLNPPHVGACRSCGDLLDAGAPTEQVRQPPLAILDLDRDTTRDATGDAGNPAQGGPIPIDRALVLGRRPDAAAAQTTARARLVQLADDASVSRTHLRIDVEDWTLTVTDCGSRSGTAIVSRPGEEPRILEPWLPHELPIGARLFLGGPTSVVIRPAGNR